MLKQYIQFQMRPIISSTQLIAACGLYCGACRKYRRNRCPGCRTPDSEILSLGLPRNKWLQRCGIRKCCKTKGFSTCAECDTDVRCCEKHNGLVGRLFSLLFNSDRAACIRFIRKNGVEAFANWMSWNEQKTIRKRT